MRVSRVIIVTVLFSALGSLSAGLAGTTVSLPRTTFLTSRSAEPVAVELIMEEIYREVGATPDQIAKLKDLNARIQVARHVTSMTWRLWRD